MMKRRRPDHLKTSFVLACFPRLWKTAGILAVWSAATCSVPAVHAARASWRHSPSPYRAEFSIQSHPNHPRGGLAVYVPVCGLGRENGYDIIAYDNAGRQLALLIIGPSVQNSVAALVRPEPTTKRVYVYFGSRLPSPENRHAFLPSLIVDIRTFPEGSFNSWKEVQQLIRKSQRKGVLFMDKIALSYNPIDSDDSFIMIFTGYLRVTQPGEQTFMLVSDDAGYLFIDEKMLLQRNGRQWARTAQRGECRASVNLKPGVHSIRCIVVEAGGEQMAVVGRWINPRKKYVLPPDAFVQPGKTKLVKVEARYPSDPCPSFWYKQRSYMSYNGAQFTEVELGTWNGRRAEWRFSDGAGLSGAKVTRVFPGLYTRSISVRQGRVTARGSIAFPETPPRQRFMSSTKDFDYYKSLIFQVDPKSLNVRTLLGYIRFLNYREFNEDAIPLYQAVIAKTRSSQREHRDALRGLARCAARSKPDLAEKAWAMLLKIVGSSELEAVGREYIEFLLYRRRDPAAAERVLRKLAANRRVSRMTVQILRVQIAVQKGDVEQAKKELGDLAARREFAENQRYAVVKSNALRERFYELLNRGFLMDAYRVLHEWEDISADDHVNGALALARARYWKKRGWYDGALAILDGAILVNPLLPYLPDVELERAEICRLAGDRKKEREILERIVKEYPNHPVAATARRRLNLR